MADHKSVTRMLKTARGQIDGILRMVEEDRYCVDISTQLMAHRRSSRALTPTCSRRISRAA
ncbi:MAG: metal-sensing transcriptional repressor [Collinsella sp.]